MRRIHTKTDEALEYTLMGALALCGAAVVVACIPPSAPPVHAARFAPPSYASIGDAWDLAQHYPPGCRGVVLTDDGYAPEGCPVADSTPGTERSE